MDIKSLVEGLKSEDHRNKQITKRFQWLLLIIIPFYAFIFFIVPNEEARVINHTMGVCYILAFAIFALIFRSYYKDYKNVDYSLPTLQMMKKAALRYKLIHKRLLLLIVPILLIDLNTSLYVTYDLKYYETIWQNILIVQAIIIPLLAIAFGIGVLIWYKRQKPLRDNALLLINDIER